MGDCVNNETSSTPARYACLYAVEVAGDKTVRDVEWHVILCQSTEEVWLARQAVLVLPGVTRTELGTIDASSPDSPSYTCCYCRRSFAGKNRYEIPPDYPQNPAHAGLPLCDACGGPVSPGPTLEEICERLDAESLEVK